MREILFRGKRIDNGEWVYGYYARKGADKESFRHYICVSTFSSDYQSNYTYPFYLYDYEVDPSTVGQYTGLTANGKKIFEGDIVKVTGLYPDRDGEKRIWRQSRVGEVFYYHGAFYFDKWLLCKTSEKCIEVIGNIHDNPELLEDKP